MNYTCEPIGTQGAIWCHSVLRFRALDFGILITVAGLIVLAGIYAVHRVLR